MSVYALEISYGLSAIDHKMTINTTGVNETYTPDAYPFAPDGYDVSTFDTTGNVSTALYWEDYVSHLVARMKLNQDSTVKIQGALLKRYSDTPNSNGYYEIVEERAVRFKIPTDASLTAGGLTGQYAELKYHGRGTLASEGFDPAYTTSFNRLFGVSGLLNNQPDYIPASSIGGSPGNRLFDLSNTVNFLQRVSFSKKKGLWDWVLLSDALPVFKHKSDNRAYKKFSY